MSLTETLLPKDQTEPPMPVVSFDTSLGEDFSWVDVDYQRLNAAIIDAGVPEEMLSGVAVHLTSFAKARAAGALIKKMRTGGKMHRLEARAARAFGYSDHQIAFPLPIMVQGHTFPSASRQGWQDTLKRSLDYDLPDEATQGYSSGDHLGIVLAHESKHAADKVANVKAPTKERISNVAHATTALLSKAGWTDIAIQFFSGDKFIPYHPYIYGALGAVGVNFLYKNADPRSKRYYRSQEERRANQYVVETLKKGDKNPWREVVYVEHR